MSITQSTAGAGGGDIEKVAKAIEAADCGYSIKLTSLTSEGSVYTLDLCDGSDLQTFPDAEDARECANRHRSMARAKAAIAALASAPPAGQGNGAPAGWKLVPVEPTEDMIGRLTHIITASAWGRENVIKQYGWLLASAPPAPTPDAGQRMLSPGDFGLLLQDILRQFARDVEASPVRPGMSVEEFSPRFEAMRCASEAVMAAASRLATVSAPTPEAGSGLDEPMTSTDAVRLWEIEQAGGPANSTEALLMHEAETKASASPRPAEDLAKLDARAPKGEWHPDFYDVHDEDGGPTEMACEGIVSYDDGDDAGQIATCNERVAEFICALVNAWRYGRLVEASASPPPGEDLAGQGEPVAWAEVRAACSAVVAASEAANGVDPTDEQLDRLWDAIDGIRGIASADSRPLYAAPAPSQPADLALTEDDLVLLMAREWLDATGGGGRALESVGDFATLSPEDHAACQKIAAAILERLALRDAPRNGGDGWEPIAKLAPQTNAVLGRWARSGETEDGKPYFYWQRATGRFFDYAGERHWCLEGTQSFANGPFYGEAPTHFYAIPEAPPSPNAGDGTLPSGVNGDSNGR